MANSREDLQQAWLTHRRAVGAASANATIRIETGAESLDDVPEDRRDDAIAALTAPTSGVIGFIDPPKIWAKWNSAGRRAPESTDE